MIQINRNEIVCSDVLAYLKTLPDESVNCVITSPPYWGLRDYGTGEWVGGAPECDHKPRKHGENALSNREGTLRDKAFSICPKCGAHKVDNQLGLEPTLREFIEKLVTIFREVRRVLRKDGTLWINMGDSYASSVNGRSAADTKEIGSDDRAFRDKPFSTVGQGIKPKDLCGQPWRLAFALQDDGWYLRQDIIWAKRNPMPESVNDRCTKSHEYVFLLTKSPRYWFDSEAIREPQKAESIERVQRGCNGDGDRGYPNGPQNHLKDYMGKSRDEAEALPGRNKRSVWTIPTEPNRYAHYATFPRKLIEPMILAGCPEKCCSVCGKPWIREVNKSGGTIGESWHNHENDLGAGMSQCGGVGNASNENGQYYQRTDLGLKPGCECNGETLPGIVLDIFMGSGTTALVARSLGRDYIGCELNPDYIAIANERLREPFEPHYIEKPDKPLPRPRIEHDGQVWEQQTLFD